MENTDLFLSYNSGDQQAVSEIQQLLELREIRTFRDRDNLTAGLPWPQALEEALESAGAVAVFLGPYGLGSWQKREMYFALDRQAQAEKDGKKFPVIPVLLKEAKLPAGFLFLNTWVDLRQGSSISAINSLAQAVKTGKSIENEQQDLLVCPFRSLRPFNEEDAAFYFGRESFASMLREKTIALQGKTNQAKVLAVVGSSGSGKSSVVLAGLLPLLRRERPPNLTWDAAVFTPGNKPWQRLADALIPLLEPELSEAKRIDESGILAKALTGDAGLQSTVERIVKKSNGTDRLLLIVDQFEELLTLTAKEDRAPFIDSLLQASKAPLMTLLLTLRGDYYGGAIAASRELSDALIAGQVNLGPMTHNELRDVIEKPAGVVGLTFESGLVDQILDDVGAEPGNLPLLEYALTEMWNLRVGNKLTLDSYNELGKVSGAIAVRAEAVYSALSTEQQQAARHLLTRLVRVARGSEEGGDTRRRVKRNELGEGEWNLVEVFAGQQTRLLVTSNDLHTGTETVEVAHEALIRNWERLRNWLDEERDFLLWRQRQLAVYLSDWESSDKGNLLRGEALSRAQEWLRKKRGELNEHERAFISQSASAVRRNRGALYAIIAFVVVLLVGAAGLFYISRTDRYQISTILKEPLEENLLTGFNPGNNRRFIPALLQLGRLEELKQTSLKQTGLSSQAFYLAAVAEGLAKMGRGRESLEVFDQTIKMTVDNVDNDSKIAALISIVSSLRRVGNTEKADAVLDQTVQLALRSGGPRSKVFNLTSIANLQSKLDQDKSRRLLQTAEQISAVITDPLQQADALISLAEAWTRIEPKKAITFLQTVESVSPRISDSEGRSAVLSELSKSMAAAGDINKAQSIALQIDDIVYRDSALARTVEAQIEQGDVDGALQNISRMAESENLIGALNVVMKSLVEHGQTVEAERIAQKQLGFDKARVLGSLSQLLAHSNRIEEAQRVAESISIDAAQQSIAYSFIAKELAIMGKSNEALRMLEMAQTITNKLDSDRLYRDEAVQRITEGLAVLHKYREARLTAETIKNNRIRQTAQAIILREYAYQQNPSLRNVNIGSETTEDQ